MAIVDNHYMVYDSIQLFSCIDFSRTEVNKHHKLFSDFFQRFLSAEISSNYLI